MRILTVWLPLCFSAFAQVPATIDVDTTHTTPLNPNFSGFNDEVVFPAEFFDYRLNNLAAQLLPGWVRYPSGLFSNAFNWQTGLMNLSWANQFQGTNVATLLTNGVSWVNGKGGGSFVDAANRANFLNAKLIVSVNAFTDTPQSAGQMAAFAKANHIPVAVWELANEPYLYSSFFKSGADYVTQMQTFRDASKAADANAVVAIFFMAAGDTVDALHEAATVTGVDAVVALQKAHGGFLALDLQRPGGMDDVSSEPAGDEQRNAAGRGPCAQPAAGQRDDGEHSQGDGSRQSHRCFCT